MIDVLRPAPKDGIYPKHIKELVGKQVKNDIKKGEHFTWKMFK
jgi:sialic acid synthase SpsE